MNPPGEVTRILLDLQAGDSSAVERLTPMLYDELRHLAGALLRRERPGHTLQATALVHEAWVKLVDASQINVQTRAHFMAIAAKVMRRILVDHARRHRAGKRGSGAAKVSIDEQLDFSPQRSRDIEALDDALNGLAGLDPRKAQVIELRYFGGLTGEEIAAALNISTATVTRELRMAQAWLAKELQSPAQ